MDKSVLFHTIELHVKDVSYMLLSGNMFDEVAADSCSAI